MEIDEAVQRLRALREARKLSQAKTAAIAGIRPSRLQNYEAGIRTPDLPTLRRWAAAFGQEVVFDLRDESGADQAERIAADLREMEPPRAELAGRLVELARQADPSHLRAGIAAIEAIMRAAGAELPGDRAGRRARA